MAMKNLRQLATNYDPSPQRQYAISRWLNRLQLGNQQSLPVLLAVVLLLAVTFGLFEPGCFSASATSST